MIGAVERELEEVEVPYKRECEVRARWDFSFLFGEIFDSNDKKQDDVYPACFHA